MPTREDRRAYVLLRGYSLAAAGEHESYLSIVRAVVSEGYPEAAAWLNQITVRQALNGICTWAPEGRGRFSQRAGAAPEPARGVFASMAGQLPAKGRHGRALAIVGAIRAPNDRQTDVSAWRDGQQQGRTGMVRTEDRLAYVARHAYALARTGVFEDFAAIEREITEEGFAGEARWLDRPGVRDALDEECIANRWPIVRRPTGAF
jgi:hypothetical protein